MDLPNHLSCDSFPQPQPAGASTVLSPSSPLPEHGPPAQSETRLTFSVASDRRHSQTPRPPVPTARSNVPLVNQTTRFVPPDVVGADVGFDPQLRNYPGFSSQEGFNPWAVTQGSMDDNRPLSYYISDGRGSTSVCFLLLLIRPRLNDARNLRKWNSRSSSVGSKSKIWKHPPFNPDCNISGALEPTNFLLSDMRCRISKTSESLCRVSTAILLQHKRH
jgi:hypothetical protein